MLAVATLVVPCSCATAPTGSAWYAGGRAGTFVLVLELGDGETTAFAFDEEDTAWKVFGGYGWNLSFVRLGVEGGYVDLGDPPAAFPDLDVLLDASGVNLWGILGVDVGPLGLYGKLGGIDRNIDGEAVGVGVQSFDEDGFDPAFGLGARVRLWSVELRAEVEQYDIPDTKTAEMDSLGLAWLFQEFGRDVAISGPTRATRIGRPLPGPCRSNGQGRPEAAAGRVRPSGAVSEPGQHSLQLALPRG